MGSWVTITMVLPAPPNSIEDIDHVIAVFESRFACRFIGDDPKGASVARAASIAVICWLPGRKRQRVTYWLVPSGQPSPVIPWHMRGAPSKSYKST